MDNNMSSKLVHQKCLFLLGEAFYRYKNMNSSFVVISKLIKSNMGEKCIINVLINVSAQALRDHLECANIDKGNSSKKKIDLIDMNVYGRITEKLSKKGIEDISTKGANLILNKSNITVKSLPGFGNVSLKRKEIKPYVVKEKPLIKIRLIIFIFLISRYIR